MCIQISEIKDRKNCSETNRGNNIFKTSTSKTSKSIRWKGKEIEKAKYYGYNRKLYQVSDDPFWNCFYSNENRPLNGTNFPQDKGKKGGKRGERRDKTVILSFCEKKGHQKAGLIAFNSVDRAPFHCSCNNHGEEH